MQNVINLFFKRKQSTKRVDDMASSISCNALDQRLSRMLAFHATQPMPQSQCFAPLSNVNQNPAKS
jgi:hypothetical protein